MAEPETLSLSSEQETELALFREVTSDARGARGAVQLLQSCSWNVEQAAQLHWALIDEERAAVPSASIAASETLNIPLLDREADQEAGAQSVPGAGSARAFPGLRTAPRMWSRCSLRRLRRGLRRACASLCRLLYGLIFAGPGFHFNDADHAREPVEAFGNVLTASYGSWLRLPRFFEGPFREAMRAAHRDSKLLAVYLHSEGPHAMHFCTQVLSNQVVRAMLDDSFLLWGGDVARAEPFQVARLVQAHQYPHFSVLLPAGGGEVRMVGAVHGEVDPDAAIALLTSSLGEMESHRAEAVARFEQQIEDRQLRAQQDREYEEALELDRRRAEEQRLAEQQQLEAQRKEEEQRREELEAAARAEAEREELEKRRAQLAAGLEKAAGDAEATLRVSLRLPAGQRVERTFCPAATLQDVYDWAECCAHLRENLARGLEVPRRFVLKTSFPSTELTDTSRTIEELHLANTNIVLAALDDDD